MFCCQGFTSLRVPFANHEVTLSRPKACVTLASFATAIGRASGPHSINWKICDAQSVRATTLEKVTGKCTKCTSHDELTPYMPLCSLFTSSHVGCRVPRSEVPRTGRFGTSPTRGVDRRRVGTISCVVDRKRTIFSRGIQDNVLPGDRHHLRGKNDGSKRTYVLAILTRHALTHHGGAHQNLVGSP